MAVKRSLPRSRHEVHSLLPLQASGSHHNNPSNTIFFPWPIMKSISSNPGPPCDISSGHLNNVVQNRFLLRFLQAFGTPAYGTMRFFIIIIILFHPFILAIPNLAALRTFRHFSLPGLLIRPSGTWARVYNFLPWWLIPLPRPLEGIPIFRRRQANSCPEAYDLSFLSLTSRASM